MATITQVIQRLQNLKGNLPEIASSSIEDTKENFLGLNASQLALGLDSLGNETSLDGSLEYQPATIRHKKKYGAGLGAITDRITLYDTGKMYESETLEMSGDTISLAFNTDYAEEVLSRTGPQVLGLNSENKTSYAFGAFFEAMRPKVEEIIQIPLQ